MNLLSTVLLWLSAAIVGMAFHEAGHYFEAKSRGLKPYIGKSKRGIFVSYLPRGDEDRKAVITTGLLLGYVPLLALLFIDIYAALGFGVAWSMGSWEEWKTLLQIEKRLKESSQRTQ